MSNPILIAHGFDSLILTSPDGITWTQRHFTSSGPEIRDLWWDQNDNFVGVGDSIFTSTDGNGVTWTDTQDNVFCSPNVNFGNFGTAILFANSQWAACGSLTSSRANAIAPTSPAGSGWTLNEQTGTRTIKVGSGTTGVSSGHDLNFTTGIGMAGLAVGDVMVVAATLTPDPGNFAPTVATGWTASTVGTNPVTYIWVKTATSGDVSGGTWNFSWTDTGSSLNPVAANICAFRNVTGGVYASAHSAGTATSVNFPSATSTGATAAINVFGGVDSDGNSAPQRSGVPCVWTTVASTFSVHGILASCSIDILWRLIGGGPSPTTAMTITNTGSDPWTEATILIAGSDFGDEFFAIAANTTGNVLVAVGKRGLIYKSTNNGATWATVFNASSCSDYDGIIWNGTYFLAFQYGGGGGDMAKSLDGTSWTETLGIISPTDLYFDSNLGLWIAAGSTLADARGRVYTSVDGFTWAARYTPASGSGVQCVQAYSAGVAATGDIDVFATSSNGTSWTEIVPPNGSSTHFYPLLRWTGTLFVVLDFTTGSNNHIRTSPDGITWTNRYSDTVDDIDSIKQFGTPPVAIVFDQC